MKNRARRKSHCMACGSQQQALLVASYVAIALCSAVQSANGETLNEALLAALQHSRAVMAERARSQAAGEDVAAARAGFSPKLSLSGSLGAGGYLDGASAPGLASSAGSNNFLSDRSWSYGLNVEQPLTDGFRALSLLREASASAEASQQSVRSAEQAALIEAVGAYLDVMRSGDIMTLRTQYVAVLRQELDATIRRVKAKDAGKTDVSLVETRLAIAGLSLSQARTDAIISGHTYERITGHAPVRLSLPKAPLAELPANLEVALEEARRQHPASLAARRRYDASEHEVGRAQSAFWPKATLNANYGRSQSTSPSVTSGVEADVSVRVVVPLWQGGEDLALIRKARYLNEARAHEVQETDTRVKSELGAAWARNLAAQEQLTLVRAGLNASEAVVTDIRRLNLHGEKTVYDLLNAEQDLADARVKAVQTSYAAVLAAFTVLSAVGSLSPATIGGQSQGPEVGLALPSRGIRDPWHAQVRTRAIAGDREGWDAKVSR